MNEKTWGGRFREATENIVESFTESVSFDARLYSQDIRVSQAHARMLVKVGLLTPEEGEQIVEALQTIKNDIEAGRIVWRQELEDIHTHIERALIERVGEVGRKLHMGRSRNDQVVTDLRLWIREAIDHLDALLADWQRAFLERAEAELDVILPGYTHLQRAQPILAGHYYCAWLEKWQRDRDRLADCRKRVNVSPLGAAALAGTSLPIDREFVRQELGFATLCRNSLDAVSDRDFAVEFVSALALLAVHLSSWAEEWILWATTEFGFLDLPDRFCTGSSIMPHKKNPDVLELIRGQAGRVMARLTQLLTLLKGLPLSYNRDLQEDKLAVFDASDTIMRCLTVAIPLVRASRLRRQNIAATLDYGFLDATTLMEYLVRLGIPMRTAHEKVGQLVQECERRHCRLQDLPPEVYDALVPGLGASVYEVLGIEAAIAAFQSAGSTARVEVEKQIAYWRQHLQSQPWASPSPY
ncbi:MAG: argininosuccinate lyase [Gemmatales bacterium]|nr:argininosuccinate lyase [Gemmatales bacterium]MDW7994297.1 argininosuccinate lyase [Gemmatales bacterium]